MKLSAHQSNDVTKVLLLGDAKSGKTGDQYVRLLIALPEGGDADLESFFRDRQETAARGAKE